MCTIVVSLPESQSLRHLKEVKQSNRVFALRSRPTPARPSHRRSRRLIHTAPRQARRRSAAVGINAPLATDLATPLFSPRASQRPMLALPRVSPASAARCQYSAALLPLARPPRPPPARFFAPRSLPTPAVGYGQETTMVVIGGPNPSEWYGWNAAFRSMRVRRSAPGAPRSVQEIFDQRISARLAAQLRVHG